LPRSPAAFRGGAFRRECLGALSTAGGVRRFARKETLMPIALLGLVAFGVGMWALAHFFAHFHF
jgi:hypothetical protein